MAGDRDSDSRGVGRRSGSRGASPFVNHEAAIAFLNATTNIERVRPDRIGSEVWKLDRMRALMSALGDPQEGLEIVHIAGSKGKGSVCNMLEGALEGCGYTTGVFTSPHLVDIRERVRVGGVPITEPAFDGALALCRSAAGSVEGEHGKATYFELLTALALVVFAEQAVDLVVLETGLGGRLDCTNVVQPRVVGLTSIHLEHTQILGDTLELIAGEKAGIIKPGTVAISVAQDPGVLEVFRNQAESVGASLRVLGEGIDGGVLYTERFQSGVRGGPNAFVCVGEEGVGFEHVGVPLMGMHQAPNCGLVLAVLLALREMGFDVPEIGVLAGLAQVRPRARLEQVLDRPRIMIDGAHTPESVRSVMKAVAAHLDYDSLIVVFGCASDKDVGGMVDALAMGADKVVFTRSSNNPRACEPAYLLSRGQARGGYMCESAPGVREAINNAAAACDPAQDLILVMGSFYIAGEAKHLIESKLAKR